MYSAREFVQVGKLRVDSRLLESRSVAPCRLEECQAACCGHGAYVDLAQASRIIEEADLVKPHMPADRHDADAWFDGNVVADPDFPSGYRVGSEVIDDPRHPIGTRCVFLRPDNHCALQAASIAKSQYPWNLKPFYCALYPLVLTGDMLLLDDDNELYALGGTCQKAQLMSTPLYMLFKDELTLALGREGYDQLCLKASAQVGVDR